MADGGWVVLGTALGTLGSIMTTWLTAYLNKEPVDPYDTAAFALLKAALEGKHKWRDVTNLANMIGLDKKTTKEYLLILGARGSQEDGNMWDWSPEIR